MQLRLNKYDIIVTLAILIVSLVMLFYVLNNDVTSEKKADVYYENNLVYTFDLNKQENVKFEIEATNGLVVIESENGKVRVIQETSNKNICSIQGWSDSIINPIVCLPNNLYIKISSSSDEDVDVFVK